MIFKKRLLMVFGILVVMISLFAYGQNRIIMRTKAQLVKRIGTTETADWKKLAEQQLIDMKNRLDSHYMDENHKSASRLTGVITCERKRGPKWFTRRARNW